MEFKPRGKPKKQSIKEIKPARVFRELMDAMIQEKEIFVIVSKATQRG